MEFLHDNKDLFIQAINLVFSKTKIRPEIIEKDGVQCSAEGCLSLPGKQGTTIRPMTVKVKAQNRNGNWCVYKGTELKAKAFCHEIDHLDGILYIDNLASEEEIKKYCKE